MFMSNMDLPFNMAQLLVQIQFMSRKSEWKPAVSKQPGHGESIHNLSVNDAVQSREEICIGITQLLCAETF